MNTTVVVEEGDFRRLVSLPEIVKLLPALNQYRALVNQGCNCHNAERAVKVTALKRQISTLTGDPLVRVKAALHATHLRVIYRDPGGKLQDRTI